MSSGIYEIRNMVNGKRYIGSAVRLSSRKASHFFHLRHGDHQNRHLQSAFNLYGEENFIFTALYECQPEELIRCEQEEIDVLKPEYNQRPIADSNRGYRYPDEVKKNMGGKKGYRHTLEAKEKIAIAGTGRMHSQETKDYLSKINTGKHHSEETRKILSEVNSGENHHYYGKHFTEEHKKHLSESNKGKQDGEKSHAYGKPVSEETKRKISIANSGEKNGMYGKKQSAETIAKRLASAKRTRENRQTL